MTTKLFRHILSLAFVFAICSISLCGQVRSVPTNDSVSADKSAPSTKSIFENEPIEEMHVRRIIKLAEKQHLENLDRAREAAKLSANLKQAFLSTKALDVSDRKKLEKVEKLTRRVRSEAGGSDSEAALERVPSDLEDALSRLADLSEQMRKEVEKTPRQVVSTAVIECANRLLEVLEYTRRFSH
ncbi:MAG: hypothetical protein ABI596_10880 [Pyrinomonadaceae bacterium]